MPEWDVIVIGAGAAGLLGAICATERGRRTLLIEKNRKPGVKILMSGGTRCNLTQATDARGIVAAFGDQGKFLHSALAAFGPQDLVDLVEAEGVPTKIESTGKIFPVSNKAADVLNALLRRFHRTGGALALDEPVLNLKRAADSFLVGTASRELASSRVILTTGGQSYPGCGTAGDGYAWARQFGHTIVPPRPALVPVTTTAGWVHDLSGVTVPDVAVRIVANDQHPGCSAAAGVLCSALPRSTSRDSFLFTHVGLSGPAVLDVSREITALTDPAAAELECDFLPDLSTEQFETDLKDRAATAGRTGITGVLPEHLPRRLVDALLQQIGISPEHRAAELSRVQRSQIVRGFKQCRIPVAGTLGFKKAEVTAGGVRLDEVESGTMQSKFVPGLFLAGEILDLDGPIGGYNFQAAFSTGWQAGQYA